MVHEQCDGVPDHNVSQSQRELTIWPGQKCDGQHICAFSNAGIAPFGSVKRKPSVGKYSA